MTTADWAREYFERGYSQRWGLPAPSESIRSEARGISRLLTLAQGAHVIDVGCGHGRHALALAERGSIVTGVDFSAALLNRANQLAAESGARPRWVRGDMRRLPILDRCADAVVIIDAFGFFEADDDDDAVVREAGRVLRTGGPVLMKVVNGVPILSAFRDAHREHRDGVDVSIARELLSNPPRLVERLSVSGSRGQGHYERRQRLYRPEELGAILERAGFSVTGVYANTERAPFDPAESSTVWMMGRRYAGTPITR